MVSTLVNAGVGTVTALPRMRSCLRGLAVLRRVRDRIDRDYTEPLDIESLARGANILAGNLIRMNQVA
ncbi:MULTISPECIES: hypothetical protein [unclassified Leucobacter]|uniref:hypothetical protein n=1 Tax=unclassified Leucobacter TaxID=2621730 RepID=UPI00165EA49C|nr:hypothetical protein [Leucobacter sp. cx-87]